MTLGAPDLPSVETQVFFSTSPLVPMYDLQTEWEPFDQWFGWAHGSGDMRTLHLIGLENAPYSNAQMRNSTSQNPGESHPGTQYILEAVRFLFSDQTGLSLPNGLKRYADNKPDDLNTYCNIFVNDVTRILHCEIPNNPAITNVKSMFNWLTSPVGEAAGWQHIVDVQPSIEAQQRSDDGQVAIMIRAAEQNSDHVALVRPRFDDLWGHTSPGAIQLDNNGVYWPHIAQAGRVGEVSSDIDSKQVFGRDKRNEIHFFWHE